MPNPGPKSNYGFSVAILVAILTHSCRVYFGNADIVSFKASTLAVNVVVSLVCHDINNRIGRPDWIIGRIVLGDIFAPVLATQLFQPRPHYSYDCPYVWSYLCYELAPVNQTLQLERTAFCHNQHGHDAQVAQAHVRREHPNLPRRTVEHKMASICLAFDTEVRNEAAGWSPELVLGAKRWANAAGRCFRGFRSDLGAAWTDLTPIK